jgi:hypothetical protein
MASFLIKQFFYKLKFLEENRPIKLYVAQTLQIEKVSGV